MLLMEDFKANLKKVIFQEDEIVLVYSGIWTFGHRFHLPVEAVPNLLLDAIENVVGRERTLLFPTYTYVYNRERKFNALTTKPETGVLPELFLGRTGVRRTCSAISSFAVKGPLADQLISLKGESIWGPGSLVEEIERRNARIVTVGLPWSISCGFLHRIEEVAAVPYRYYKDFPGEYIDGTGVRQNWTERMYVRPLNVPCRFNWNLVSKLMQDRGQIVSGSSPGVQIESCLARDMVKTGSDLLVPNPYAFVVNSDEVKDWVENGGKRDEIATFRAGLSKNDYAYRN